MLPNKKNMHRNIDYPIFINKEKSYFLKEIVLVLVIGIVSRCFIIGMFLAFDKYSSTHRSFDHIMCAADCAYYLDIAQQGYATFSYGNPGTWSFFPLYSFIAKILIFFSGMNAVFALLTVSNIAFLTGLCVFYFYTKNFIDAKISWFSTILVAFSPHSIYFSVPYAEALYFLLIVSTMYLTRAGHFLSTGFCGAFLSATRPFGVFTVFPVIAVYVEKYGWRSFIDFKERFWRIWFSIIILPLGLFVYMFYMYFHTGVALAFKYARVFWGGTSKLKFPFVRVINKHIFADPMFAYYSFVTCFAVFGAIYLMRKRLWADGLVLLITPMLTTIVQGTFGMPRFVFALYPIYLVLGLLTRSSLFSRILLLLFCFIGNIYYVWGWFYIRDFIG